MTMTEVAEAPLHGRVVAGLVAFGDRMKSSGPQTECETDAEIQYEHGDDARHREQEPTAGIPLGVFSDLEERVCVDKPATGLTSLPKYEQVLLSTQVDASIQYGGRGEDLLAQVIPRQNFERVAAIEHHHGAFLRGDVDAPVCADG